MAKYRQNRVNDAVKQEMAQILRDVKDPRIAGAFVSITGAVVTKDLKFAKIYYSVLGDDKAEVLKALKKATGFFRSELAKRITVPVSMDFMSVSSYGNDTKSSGVVKIVKDLDETIKGKDVLVVEDIVDSGRTLSYLLDNLKSRQPASLRLCTLLDKPERRVIDVNVDYTGFQIPDEFVVGYGLDYAQKYRNLPYIGVVEL